MLHPLFQLGQDLSQHQSLVRNPNPQKQNNAVSYYSEREWKKINIEKKRLAVTELK